MSSKKSIHGSQPVEFKKGEDDEDTLSLDSEKSQEFINEPVQNWPSWSVEGNQVQQQQQQVLSGYGTNVPSYSHNFPQPNFYRGPVSFPKSNPQQMQAPVYFSRQPVYQPPQFNPLINNVPQQQHQQYQQHYQQQQQQQPQQRHR